MRGAWRAGVLALAIPFLFLHDTYQPHLVVHGLVLRLTDLALLCAVVAAVWDMRRSPPDFRAGRAVWIAAGVFLVVTFAACFYPRLYDSSYPTGASFVTALKYSEYAMLAPLVVVLLRTRRDLEIVLGALVVWSCAMTTVGALQFLGVLDEFNGKRPGQREPSYVGITDFAGLSAASLAVGLALLALGRVGRERAAGYVAVVSGALGLVLAGSVAGAIAAVGCGGVVCVAAGARRTLTLSSLGTVAVSVAVVCLGVLALRGSDLARFAAFLGLHPQNAGSANIQTYSQRTVLAYIGYRVWLRHPIVGSGFLASTQDPAAYMPVVPAARRHFRNVDPAAFPSPTNKWGVQNLYIETLADLGIVGFAALLALLGAAALYLVRALRSAPDDAALVAAVAGGSLVGVGAIFLAEGIVAGIPLDAVLWLSIGLAVRAHMLSLRPAIA